MKHGTALVTGAHGFLGRYTARAYAKQGWSVVGLGHGDWPRAEWGKWGLADWRTCDIDLASLRNFGGTPDVIVHCAGGGSVGFSIAHPYEDYQRTVVSTLAVLEFVRTQAPKCRVVYPSSAAVYGRAETLPISESAPLKPLSPYGVHKKAAEELCLSYAQHFDVSVAIVRLFSAFGVGLRKQLPWDACSKISNNETHFAGTGDETRDWLLADEVASLLLLAAEHASTDCTIVNGGSGEQVTVRDLLTEIFAAFGRKDSPVFSGTKRPGDPSHYLADTSRIQKWGWKPTLDWCDGVREYVEWFKRGAL